MIADDQAVVIIGGSGILLGYLLGIWAAWMDKRRADYKRLREERDAR